MRDGEGEVRGEEGEEGGRGERRETGEERRSQVQAQSSQLLFRREYY